MKVVKIQRPRGCKSSPDIKRLIGLELNRYQSGYNKFLDCDPQGAEFSRPLSHSLMNETHLALEICSSTAFRLFKNYYKYAMCMSQKLKQHGPHSIVKLSFGLTLQPQAHK